MAETTTARESSTTATGDQRAENAAPPSRFEFAQLRLLAFTALRGWGAVREDGKFKSWSSSELRPVADELARWSLSDTMLFCGFCGKSHRDVKKLIGGATAYICDECVALSAEIVAGKEPQQAAASGSPVATSPSNAEGVVP